MGLAQDISRDMSFAEDIRLVIWDLDETFWDGTLTEGGITYREDHHALVKELAARGIMSSICSKNDLEPIEALLKERGLWEYFIFPSVDWTPKGPRIKAMLQQIGLRAPSVLFVDDNAMNLAQARHMNPGLNVAMPDVIAGVLDAPEFIGKPDAGLTRLAQYKINERKLIAAGDVGGDTVAFLRQSNVRVYLEYYVEAHLDRAIELINRTNQLNFTKKRLPDNPDLARAELLKVLALNTTDAALIRVRDDFGDYGFAGFYLTRRMHNERQIEHFCFSCRTLNMFIEHWVYDQLGRLPLEPVGDVLTDPTSRAVDVNWITPAPIADMEVAHAAPVMRFDRIIARGGCDLASLMHYFALHTDEIVEEFNQPKNGQMFRRDHSSFLMPALKGDLDKGALDAATSLGYERADFDSALFSEGDGAPLYFLSFWADADIPLYLHRQSGMCLPYWLVGAQNHDLIAKTELRDAVAETDLHRSRLGTLCRDFEHVGLLDADQMQQRYAQIIDALPNTAPVVVVLANERGPLHFHDPSKPDHPHHKRLNNALRLVAEGRQNVILIDPMAHISGGCDMLDLNHFKRPVYHRMYLDALGQLAAMGQKEPQDE